MEKESALKMRPAELAQKFVELSVKYSELLKEYDRVLVEKVTSLGRLKRGRSQQ